MIVDGRVGADVAGHGEIETARYTRGSGKNKKTSHAFEYETDVDAEAATGSERKVGEVKGTRQSRITGDNSREHLKRVQRVQADSSRRHRG